MHLTNGEPRAARAGSRSRMTRLIAALYGTVTDSHAYFIVLKDFGRTRPCRGCNVEKPNLAAVTGAAAAAVAKKPELGPRVSRPLGD